MYVVILTKLLYMLEFSKRILSKVSFDQHLFRRELQKSVRWVNKKESMHLKIWALATFSEYKDIIIKVFDNLS